MARRGNTAVQERSENTAPDPSHEFLQQLDGTKLDPRIAAALGLNVGTTLSAADDDIAYHPGKAILVPEGMSMEHVADVAKKKAAELNKVHSFQHFTQFRPDDGAHAAAVVMKRMFGLTIGKETKTMFGEEPPAYRTINVAHNRKMDVPWGRLEVPALPGAEFVLDAARSQNGPVFVVHVQAPKKHKAKIEDFFAAVDEELRTNSIYRGKALLGAYELTFMNVGTFKSNQIVFSDEVQNSLEAGVFTLIEHTESVIDAGLPSKRAILAYGPYGTGKSSLGLITAQRANAAGWTFLSARAGRDELRPVLQTAALYEPAVVFVEDIDAHTPKAEDKDGISELLDLFDGIGTKNSKLIVVMTTNHIDRVPAGMLRPGRLDYCVEIAGLDRNGIERLVKAVIPGQLLAEDIDYDAVYAEMEHFQPAWVRATTDRAQSYRIARANGDLTYQITTEDLVGAARSLQPQLGIMEKALEGYTQPELETVLQHHVKTALDGMSVVDSDGDQTWALAAMPSGHAWR